VLNGNDYLNLLQPDDRIFVASKGGVISTVNPSTYQVTGTYLDISARVWNNGERGLLGLAFHPDFQSNGRFFVVSNCNIATGFFGRQSYAAKFFTSKTDILCII
jgi:hypothetical protein